MGAGALPPGALTPAGPALPAALEPVRRLPAEAPQDELDLTGARIEAELAIRARRVVLTECVLGDATIAPDDPSDRSSSHQIQLLT